MDALDFDTSGDDRILRVDGSKRTGRNGGGNDENDDDDDGGEGQGA